MAPLPRFLLVRHRRKGADLHTGRFLWCSRGRTLYSVLDPSPCSPHRWNHILGESRKPSTSASCEHTGTGSRAAQHLRVPPRGAGAPGRVLNTAAPSPSKATMCPPELWPHTVDHLLRAKQLFKFSEFSVFRQQGPTSWVPPSTVLSRQNHAVAARRARAQAPSHRNEPLAFTQYCWSPQGGVSAAHSSTSGTQGQSREAPGAPVEVTRLVTRHYPQPRPAGQEGPLCGGRVSVFLPQVPLPGGRGDEGHFVPPGAGPPQGASSKREHLGAARTRRSSGSVSDHPPPHSRWDSRDRSATPDRPKGSPLAGTWASGRAPWLRPGPPQGCCGAGGKPELTGRLGLRGKGAAETHAPTRRGTWGRGTRPRAGTAHAVCVRVRKARLPAAAQRPDTQTLALLSPRTALQAESRSAPPFPCLCLGKGEGREERRAGRAQDARKGSGEEGPGHPGVPPSSPTQAPPSCAQPTAHWPQSLLLGPVHVLHDSSQAGKQRGHGSGAGMPFSVKTEHKGHFSK